jgi:hypothetical protein
LRTTHCCIASSTHVCSSIQQAGRGVQWLCPLNLLLLRNMTNPLEMRPKHSTLCDSASQLRGCHTFAATKTAPLKTTQRQAQPIYQGHATPRKANHHVGHSVDRRQSHHKAIPTYPKWQSKCTVAPDRITAALRQDKPQGHG